MLLIIRVQIIQREAIMAGQKVHTGIVTGIVALGIGVIAAVQIAGAGNAPCGVP